VKRIFLLDAAGAAPTRKSLNAGPVCVPPLPATDDVIALGDQLRRTPEN
jgi:hypothetical protein